MTGEIGQYLLRNVPVLHLLHPILPFAVGRILDGIEGDLKPPLVSPAIKGEDACVHSHAVS